MSESACKECRPSEVDMIESPRAPDLRCSEHEGVCDVVHGLLGRLMVLESRVKELEKE